MPTYERVVDGQVVERSTTVADHPSGFDEQMAALADDPLSDWRRVDEPAPTSPPVPDAPPLVDEQEPELVGPPPSTVVESIPDTEPEEN